MLKPFNKTILYHVLAWLAFICYMILSNYSFYKDQYSVDFFLFKQITYCAVFMIPFYVNYCWLIPACFIGQRRPVLFISGIIGLLLLDFLLNVLHGWMLDLYLGQPEFMQDRLANFGYILYPMLFLGVSSGLRLSVQYYREQNEKKELRQQVADAEMTLLKSQINPHFLFNTLNNIYALAQKRSELTADAVLKLSDIMRYVLHEASEDLVSLRQEVSFIRNYISLQKLRIKTGVEIEEDMVLPEEDLYLPPLLFIPFVENAFKHSDLVNEQRPVRIHLKMDRNVLYFEVVNSIGDHEKDRSSGVGLVNLRKRLRLLFPGKHHLQTRRNGQNFNSSLRLEFG